MSVVVRDEDAEHLFEMPSAEDQEPIETFGASGADKACGVQKIGSACKSAQLPRRT
jgi:hypothetical protein